jgi:hypothetical protein
VLTPKPTTSNFLSGSIDYPESQVAVRVILMRGISKYLHIKVITGKIKPDGFLLRRKYIKAK